MKKILFFTLVLGCMACTTLPTSSEYVARGDGFVKDDKLEKALTAYNKAVELNPNNLDAYTSRGAAHFFAGNFSLAQKDFQYVLTRNPYYADVYTALASALAAQGDFENALRMIEQAIALKPNRPENIVSRAGIYFMLERYDEALADYSLVLQYYPAAEVFQARGAVYQKMGQEALAKRDFEAAASAGIPATLETYKALTK